MAYTEDTEEGETKNKVFDRGHTSFGLEKV